MAVTKIKPIRGTVNKALAYILDPEKTDDQLYVSSFGCAASDAAAKEFEWTRNLAAQQGMQMPKVIARHLIQSFDIGEVTPEMAHEIGKLRILDRKAVIMHKFIISPHPAIVKIQRYQPHEYRIGVEEVHHSRGPARRACNPHLGRLAVCGGKGLQPVYIMDHGLDPHIGIVILHMQRISVNQGKHEK